MLSSAAMAAARAQVPVFFDFQVNTYTTQGQKVRSIAAAADGRFVVIWQSVNQDGGSYGVFGTRFDSNGFRLGFEFRVNTYTLNAQVNPSVAAAEDGRFVVVWNSGTQDGSGAGVFGRRFDSAGGAIGSEFQVSLYTFSGQVLAQVAAAADGAFVVTWEDYSRDGSTYGVFARRYDSAGSALGGDFQVNVYTTGNQARPVVTVLESGGFVVAWESVGQDASSQGVFARRFDSSGTPQGAEFQVNRYTLYAQLSPVLASRPDGGFLVVWESTGQDGSLDGLFARRFDASGGALAVEFRIYAYTSGSQVAPAVGIQDDGSFVVAWQDVRGTAVPSVFARGFTDSDQPLSMADFQVNTRTGTFQYGPVVAALGPTFVVAWSGGGASDGDISGVFARRWRVGVYDVDADGMVGALTDGLMVLRYEFGFHGTAVTAGALGAACTRCDPTAIENFIDSWSDYDLDGNGVREPLADGLMLLRYLFGFRAAALTSGAIGDDCSNCNAAAVEAYVAARL